MDPSKGRPSVLLMGPTRAGKTSIKKVIFNKMSPHETLWLTSTSEPSVKEISNSAFVHFDILDFPGKLELQVAHYEQFFDRAGAIIFVLDAQEPTHRAEVQKICLIAQAAQEVNKNISCELFMNKAEIYCEERKQEIYREVREWVSVELNDMNLSHLVDIRCHVTSIYDQTVFERFSMVVRKLIPEHDPLENLLNILVQVCKMEKAYLFDKLCKVCVAADSVNSDDRHNELCSDMIDVFIDFSGIYGPESIYSMDGAEDIPFDPESFSAIQLSTGAEKGAPHTILYLREVAPALSLVCVIRQESFEGKMGLIDYNFRNFRNQIGEIINKRKVPE